ncbi:hypothetical protein [Candidatus Albibeggiatoa sp. nov. BB20]|uniref:hypothetical protein n=1 Tax=Candidatus Albibeggiatoa sp. nov. BB20 TaxID=3162723 RepID=UPI0033655DF7
MNTYVEQIYQQSLQLSPDNAQEVLQFIEFIKFKQKESLSETQYILNNPNLIAQIQVAEQNPEQWIKPSENQLNLAVNN